MANCYFFCRPTFKAELQVDRELNAAGLESLEGVDPAQDGPLVVGRAPAVELAVLSCELGLNSMNDDLSKAGENSLQRFGSVNVAQ